MYRGRHKLVHFPYYNVWAKTIDMYKMKNNCQSSIRKTIVFLLLKNSIAPLRDYIGFGTNCKNQTAIIRKIF